MSTTTQRDLIQWKSFFLGVGGVLFLAGLNALLGRGLVAASVQVPSSVAGMMLVFAALFACQAAAPGAAERVVAGFKPSSGFLQRWLGLFFVPPLVVLPMEYLPWGMEMAKMAVILVAGALFTLITSAWGLRLLMRGHASPPAAAESSAAGVAPMRLLRGWSALAGLSGAAGLIVASRLLETVFLLSVTVAAYVLGMVLQRRLGQQGLRSTLQRIAVTSLHPVVISALVAGGVVWGLPLAPEVYVAGEGRLPAAGAILLGLLDPAFISLGFLLFLKREVLARHVVPLLSCIAAAALLSLVATALAARLLAMEEPFALATLSRSVTTPVALPMAEVLGAAPGLTAAFVVLTGVFGAVVGLPVLRALRFKSPVVQGMAMGASAHGIGTAALMMDQQPTAAAVSAVTFVLVAATSALAVGFAPVHELLWQLIG